ncbi:MAG: hypothetical protein WC413_00970 [Candidatus Nanoarchaeia archaeon]
MEIKELIQELKRKKELSDLDEGFVEHRVVDYLKQNKLEEQFKDKKFIKTRRYDILFKDLRRLLREAYGMFRSDDFKEHPSTKSRIIYYKYIYKKIFEITGKPKKILDLGCGLNPLSYEYLGCNPFYYAADISNTELKIVNNYFKENKIKGETFTFNMVDSSYKDLPKVDVCFLFKVLEELELIKRDISEKVIKEIKADWIIASFSKVTLGGKPIKKMWRVWFEKIIKKLGLYYVIFDVGDEIFFVIKKK